MFKVNKNFVDKIYRKKLHNIMNGDGPYQRYF